MCWWLLTHVTLVARGQFSISTMSKHISFPRSFSDGEPTEWFQKYNICCDANEWEDATKAKKLPTLLEGEALAIWLELMTEEKASYATSKDKIITKMKPMQFVSLDDFWVQRLNPGESLPMFLHELKQLSKKVMPDAETATRNQLLLHQFISGLPAHIIKQLQATGEVRDLDRVLEQAKPLMTIEEPQKQLQFKLVKCKKLESRCQP